MTTEPKPCTVKGCTCKMIHHHYATGGLTGEQCGLNSGRRCTFSAEAGSPAVAPRVTKSARIATLTAENERLIERGWADEKKIVDLTAEVERLTAQTESDALVIASLGQASAATPEPDTLGTLTVAALASALRKHDADAAQQLAFVLTSLDDNGRLREPVAVQP